MLLPSNKIAFTVIAIATLMFTLGLFTYNKPELVPQLWIGVTALELSYFACMFTAEKLRLDLLDRRFDIYEKTLSFCRAVMVHGSLDASKDNKEQIAAHESFRGIGWRRTQALFGEDIVSLFKKLNESFAHVIAFGGNRASDPRFDAEKYWNHQSVSLI